MTASDTGPSHGTLHRPPGLIRRAGEEIVRLYPADRIEILGNEGGRPERRP